MRWDKSEEITKLYTGDYLTSFSQLNVNKIFLNIKTLAPENHIFNEVFLII